jgi:hypothetical protein
MEQLILKPYFTYPQFKKDMELKELARKSLEHIMPISLFATVLAPTLLAYLVA